jgi:hypothetical protein
MRYYYLPIRLLKLNVFTAPSIGKNMKLFFFLLLLYWVGLYCSIYKGSFNVSNLSHFNSSPLHCSPYLPSPDSWNSFNRYHFCIHINVYTLFALYLPSYPLPLLPPSVTGANPLSCSALMFSNFVKKNKEKKNKTFLLV